MNLIAPGVHTPNRQGPKRERQPDQVFDQPGIIRERKRSKRTGAETKPGPEPVIALGGIGEEYQSRPYHGGRKGGRERNDRTLGAAGVIRSADNCDPCCKRTPQTDAGAAAKRDSAERKSCENGTRPKITQRNNDAEKYERGKRENRCDHG